MVDIDVINFLMGDCCR